VGLTFRNNEEEMVTKRIGGSTFLVRIYFKQHANWQGTIQWLETNKTVPFRSVLELISLLNEAVEKDLTGSEGLGFRSWENMEPEEIMCGEYSDN
jgi:hypothetical protein